MAVTVRAPSNLAPGPGHRLRGMILAPGRVFGMIVVTLLGLLLVTFLIGRVLPTDPVLAIVGDKASPAVYARVRLELGLDQPLLQQFWIYCRKAVTGDFGNSILTTRPVFSDIGRVFPATIELATVSTLIGTPLGILLGVFSAARRDSLLDQVVRVVSLIGYSTPTFWLGLIGLLLFYARLRWSAGPGRVDVTYEYLYVHLTGFILLDSLLRGQADMFRNAVFHILLPASVLGYGSMAYVSRMTRSVMVRELSQEYITAARVKGLSEPRVIWGHAFRNAAVPLVTVIALSYGGLLEGAVLTETVFAWPGLGQYMTNSLRNADMNAVLGATLVIGTTFVLLNLLSDLLYELLDPRTRRA
jgi:peptide/nickel transport system permease protein